jgi:outer membrane protein assembly factor BamA
MCRRRQKKLSVLAVGLLGVVGCAHQEAPPGPVVRKLTLQGTKKVSSSTLEDGIATSATGWWWPFARKQYFDPFTWQSDLHRIERIYQAHGYYQAEVVSSQVKQLKNGVALSAKIDEGSPTLIGSLEIQGLEALEPKQRQRLSAGIGLGKDKVFLEDAWQAAKDSIRQKARDLGYPTVSVEGRALVDVDSRRASLLLLVRLGRRYRFGNIEVESGPGSRIPSAFVWEQVRLAISEDELFSDSALEEAQRRVVGMGVFALARVTTGEPDPSTDRIPIVVQVRDAPLHTLRAGAGVEIDQIRNEARLLLEWSNLDFLGGMRRFKARAELGWAFIPNAYAVFRNQVASGPRNGPIAHLGLELEQPRFLSRPSLRERTSLDIERSLEQSYDALGARLATGVVWQPWSTLSVYGSYNIQGYYLNGPPISSASAAPLTLGCTNQGLSCFILLSYLEQIITWDKRDMPLEAHNGFFASLSLQEGGLGGDFKYLRVLPDLRGYVSIGHSRPLTFSARLRMGELITFGGESAVVTRFFAGGGVSMRGFSDRRLSPLLLAPAPPSPGAPPITLSLPIGGNGMLEGSFEIRQQVSSNVILAVFADFGQVTQGLLRPADLSTLLWAVGLGIRYRTAIGPIRVDIARRLQIGHPPPLFAIDGTTGAITQVPYSVNDDCFGIGGSGRATPVTDSLCVFHIAIGEAF